MTTIRSIGVIDENSKVIWVKGMLLVKYMTNKSQVKYTESYGFKVTQLGSYVLNKGHVGGVISSKERVMILIEENKIIQVRIVVFV